MMGFYAVLSLFEVPDHAVGRFQRWNPDQGWKAPLTGRQRYLSEKVNSLSSTLRFRVRKPICPYRDGCSPTYIMIRWPL